MLTSIMYKVDNELMYGMASSGGVKITSSAKKGE